MRRQLSAVFRHPRAAADDGGGSGSVEDSTLAFLAVPRSHTRRRSGSGGGADARPRNDADDGGGVSVDNSA